MYAIATVVYGTYFNEKCHEWLEENGHDEDWFEANKIEERYHGAADYSPKWVGIELGEFDECCAAVNVAELNLAPTAAEKKEAEDRIKDLPDELRKLLPPIGVYFVWHTS